MESFSDACKDSKHIKIVKNYIQQKSDDVNLEFGLFMSAKYGAFVNAKALSDNGALFCDMDYYALELAARFNNVDVLRLGIYSGADVRSLDIKGLNLLHFACFNGAYLCVPLLIGHGIDVNKLSRGGDGLSPIQLACMHGCTTVVALLMQAGARCEFYYDDDPHYPYIFRFVNDYPEMKESRKMFKRLMVFIECNKMNPFLPRHLMWWILTKYLWSHDSLFDRLLDDEAAIRRL